MIMLAMMYEAFMMREVSCLLVNCSRRNKFHFNFGDRFSVKQELFQAHLLVEMFQAHENILLEDRFSTA